ncbi:acyl-CoA dehydrogenase family protein [Streptomyces sp. TRM49041]|uniref:acyl-CoA dehydrogenase family protein n=1 Tax=Streptomyces sp. TRM49041 TaxID=2603216 RepID=UPI0011F05F86|nr:acyl-CoA dehydrogenase family protein [Streptomyces sp. TRM49041]
MRTDFTQEQFDLRRALRRLLVERCDVRGAVAGPDGYDAGLWGLLGGQLGLAGLAVPEAYGGAGCPPGELALACEETGRALAPSPLFATAALAAPLLVRLGTDTQKETLLPRVADGTLTATLATPGAALPLALGLTGDQRGGAWAGGGRAGGVQARPRGGPDGGWLLYGEADRVLDGHSAGLLLVAARTGGYPRARTLLFLVRGEGSARGDGGRASGDGGRASGDAPVRGGARTVRVRRPSLDETRPLARVQLRDQPAELLGYDDPGAVLGALAATGRTAAAVLAAEAVGAAAYSLDRTVAYVRQREQFGRPIGSFQAVQHRLADLYVRVRAARSAAYYAAWGPAAGGLALAQCLDALGAVAADAIQLHGGTGFTWEHEAHLYFKRATADALLFGPPHRLRTHAARSDALFEGVAV